MTNIPANYALDDRDAHERAQAEQDTTRNNVGNCQRLRLLTLKAFQISQAAIVAAENKCSMKEVLDMYDTDPQDSIAAWWQRCEKDLADGVPWGGVWLRSVFDSRPCRAKLERFLKNNPGHALELDWAYYVAHRNEEKAITGKWWGM
jgi:hypothetical protein